MPALGGDCVYKSRLGMPGCDARGRDLQLQQLRHALVASADRRPRPPLPAPGARLGPTHDEGYARRLGEWPARRRAIGSHALTKRPMPDIGRGPSPRAGPGPQRGLAPPAE